MLRLLLLALLASLPASALAQGIVYDPGSEWYRPGSDWLGAVSAPSGVLDWSRSWSADWTTGTSTPVPDVECESAGSGGDLVCTGATATKSGNPTTVGAPGYPARTAVRLDGTDDNFDLGNIINQPSTLRICGDIMFPVVNIADNIVLAKDRGGGAGTRGYTLEAQNAVLRLYVFKSDAASTPIAIGTVTAGTWNSFCVSYQYVADGTSVMRANLNGIAPSAVTNAVGPIQSVGYPLRIGALSGATLLPGTFSLRGLTVDTRSDVPTDAELAALVSSQQARLAAKPLGAQVTTTSGATTCDSRGDGSLYSLPAGSLCCTAAGCEVWGAAQHGNLLTASKINAGALLNSPWLITATNTTVADGDTAPSGVASAKIIEPATGEFPWGVYHAYTYSATVYTFSAWLKKGTRECATLALTNSANGDAKFDLSAGTVVATDASATATITPAGDGYRVSVTKTMGAGAQFPELYSGGATCAGLAKATTAESKYFFAGDVSLQASPVPGPYAPTAGTPFTGAADVPSVATAAGLTAEKWAFGLRFTRAAAVGAYGRPLVWGSAAYANNSVTLEFDTAGKFYFTIDSGGTEVAKTIEAAAAMPDTNEHTLIIDSNQRTWIDGIEKTMGGAGISAPLAAMPTTLNISMPTFGENGKYKTVCQGRDRAAVARCLR